MQSLITLCSACHAQRGLVGGIQSGRILGYLLDKRLPLFTRQNLKNRDIECKSAIVQDVLPLRSSCLVNKPRFGLILYWKRHKVLIYAAKGVKSRTMIPQDLLDILVCPLCKKPLVLKDNGQSLKCGECRRVYPIRDNIPILLVDEAVTDPS